jgi:tetratricopeptide (TPR) repeat protein
MSVISAVLFAALALPVAVSTPAAPAANLDSSSPQSRPPSQRNNEAATVPQQVHRAEPPPANASATELENRGDDLRDEKYYLDALDFYRAAMVKAGETALLHNKSGIAFLQLMRFDQAKREFKQAIKLDPTYPEARNNLGVVEYYGKNYGGAVKHYKKAIKLNPDSASFHSNLGSAYFARKDYDKAMGEYARALELDPDIFERRTRGGISVHLISSEDRARYDYTLARMYARAGNLERCLIYLRKAMEEGYSGIKDVYKDSDFGAVRKDPRFNALMTSRPTAITADSERN